MTASYAGEWALFQDYCAATGQPALPTTSAAVAGFSAAVPARPATLRRRLQAIAAAHRHAGWSTGTGHLQLDRATSHGPPGARPSSAGRRSGRRSRGEDAGGVIAACPTRGWPTGFTGRRDAVLVVLVEVLGHAHRHARRLTPAEITAAGNNLRVAGVPVPGSDDPRTCPACAMARWLEVCDLADGLGHAIAREVLSAAIAPRGTSPHAHIPGHQRWRQAPWLVIGIDQHGWLHDAEPLSARSISTRLAAARLRARRRDRDTAA